MRDPLDRSTAINAQMTQAAMPYLYKQGDIAPAVLQGAQTGQGMVHAERTQDRRDELVQSQLNRNLAIQAQMEFDLQLDRDTRMIQMDRMRQDSRLAAIRVEQAEQEWGMRSKLYQNQINESGMRLGALGPQMIGDTIVATRLKGDGTSEIYEPDPGSPAFNRAVSSVLQEQDLAREKYLTQKARREEIESRPVLARQERIGAVYKQLTDLAARLEATVPLPGQEQSKEQAEQAKFINEIIGELRGSLDSLKSGEVGEVAPPPNPYEGKVTAEQQGILSNALGEDWGSKVTEIVSALEADFPGLSTQPIETQLGLVITELQRRGTQ